LNARSKKLQQRQTILPEIQSGSPHEFPREGILAALAIPVNPRGRLLKRAIASHLEWLRRCGIHGVLALGSTGEFPRFTLEERKAILEFAAELAAPLPVVANISDIRPQAVAELGRFAQRLGLPGAAVMPPSFYPVSDADQLAFFRRAADAAQLPMLLYNFPELTGNRISIDTVAAFANTARMAGIKQSGAEFAYHQELIRLGCEKNFGVFSGADTRLPEVFELGAAGCIGGLVNFVPEWMVEIFNVCRKGLPGNVNLSAERLRDTGAMMGKLTFPLNVAAGMEARGLDPGAPKTVVSSESTRIYRTLVNELRAAFKGWRLAPADKPVARTRR
jgi:4-hydroxy-tetrahydrodipicolinate synthase